MKILILTPGIFPDVYSGLPKLVYYTAQAIKDLGHDLVVLTRQYKSEHLIEEEVNGIQYYRVYIPKRGDKFHELWPFITSYKCYKKLFELRKRHPHFDIIWAQNPFWAYPFDPRKFWQGSKLFYDFHSDGYTEIINNYGPILKAKLMGNFYDHATKVACRKSDVVIAHSEYMRQRCLGVIGQDMSAKVKIVTGGADEKLFTPPNNEAHKINLKQKLKLPTDKTIFLTARGLKPRTGVDKLVLACAKLNADHIPFFMNIIGNGIMKDVITNMIDKLKLHHCISVKSNLSEEELSENFKASDVFVLPTQDIEGFGLATAEALATGLVVLGTINGATPEILSHYNKDWVIPGCDTNSIYKHLKKYCDNPQKLNLPTQKIREITINNFTWEVAAKQFLALAA